MILFGLGWLYAQHALSMGARLQAFRSHLSSYTDENSPLTTPTPTARAGITGFFSWHWTPALGTGIELGYQGVAQKYYGIGLRGEPYTASVSLQYLRIAAALHLQYTQATWGVWGSLAPGAAILTQSELSYQGDSLSSGSLITPQIAQRILTYLNQSTNPNDRLLLTQMYERTLPVISAAGGLKVRLAPQVWVLGLLFYETCLKDIEKKSFRLGEERAAVYDPTRTKTQYTLIGIQLGIQYEVPMRP